MYKSKNTISSYYKYLVCLLLILTCGNRRKIQFREFPNDSCYTHTHIHVYANVVIKQNSFSAYFFFLFSFLGPHRGIWKFPGQGSNQSCICWPTPQPQLCRIRATSATYTTAHGIARSLTHWVRPGIEPTTSQFLVRFISAVPQWELLNIIFNMK